jgi:hypothetical protein
MSEQLRLKACLVMAGLVPAIHVFGSKKNADARHKAGHDHRELPCAPQRLASVTAMIFPE